MLANPVQESGGNATLSAFLALQIIGGQIGVPFILFTVFLSPETVRRHVCFVNFCICWLIYSISYVLLLYGGQILAPDPPYSLCLAQTALTYGAGPMASGASFIFVLQIYIALNAAISVHSPKPARHRKLTLAVMLAAPYVVFLSVMIAVLVYGHMHPTNIVRTHFFCHISTKPFSLVPPAMSAIGAVLAVIVEVLIVCKVYRTWHSFRRLDASHSGISLSLLIRSALFTIFCILGIILCAGLLAKADSPAPGIAIAILPMAVFLVFGTQPDMLRAWGLWRERELTEIEFSTQLSEPSRRHQSIRFQDISTTVANKH